MYYFFVKKHDCIIANQNDSMFFKHYDMISTLRMEMFWLERVRKWDTTDADTIVI